MKCAQYVKRRGFKSLNEFSRISGFPVSTLQDWYGCQREKFNTVLEGAVVRLIKEEGVPC